jgi:hypothetical protein
VVDGNPNGNKEFDFVICAIFKLYQKFWRMPVADHLEMVAQNLVKELETIVAFKDVSTNSTLLGSFTESAVRNMVSRIVYPMRISSGAVIDHPVEHPLRQIDLIIWESFPVPAIFHVGDFGLVPKSSAFGVIEIKRSNYDCGVKSIKNFIELAKANKIVSKPLLGSLVGDASVAGLGVICVLEKNISTELQQLLEDRNAVIIFDNTGPEPRVRPKDVLILVDFLNMIMWRYKVQSSYPGARISLEISKVINPTPIHVPTKKKTDSAEPECE